MVTRTIYVPANHLGRDVLARIWQHVGCSIGDIRRVENVFRVSVTMPEREVDMVEKILKKFDLL